MVETPEWAAILDHHIKALADECNLGHLHAAQNISQVADETYHTQCKLIFVADVLGVDLVEEDDQGPDEFGDLGVLLDGRRGIVVGQGFAV